MNFLLPILTSVATSPVFENAMMGLLVQLAGQLIGSAHDPAKVMQIANSVAQAAPAIVGAVVKGTSVEKEATTAVGIFGQFMSAMNSQNPAATAVSLDKAGGATSGL